MADPRPLAEYQKPNCIFCREDIPHAVHMTRIEALKQGIVLFYKHPHKTEPEPVTKIDSNEA